MSLYMDNYLLVYMMNLYPTVIIQSEEILWVVIIAAQHLVMHSAALHNFVI